MLQAAQAAASALRGAPKYELDSASLQRSARPEDVVARQWPLVSSERTRRHLEIEHTVRHRRIRNRTDPYE